jgi:hypothetical protein
VTRIPRISDIWTGINYVRDTFPYLYFDKNVLDKKFTRGTKTFPTLGECLNNYHQAQQPNGMMVSLEPVHDEYSHGCDSLRTFCEAWQRGLISKNTQHSREFYSDAELEEGHGTKLAGGGKWTRR